MQEVSAKLCRSMKKIPNVKAVYIFGSAASGKTGALSDIDIGVLLKEKKSSKGSIDLKLKLMLISELTDIFKSNKIDLVILNDAAPLLAFEVISKGKLIYGTRSDVAEYETNTCMQYHDIRYYYDKYANETINRIAQKGLK